jgi:hypothetical protein
MVIMRRDGQGRMLLTDREHRQERSAINEQDAGIKI